MSAERWLPLLLACACGGSSEEPNPAAVAPNGAVEEALPLDPAEYVAFVEPGTGFMTDAVHDADDEVVHFESRLGVMVSGTTGETIAGWEADADGGGLRWSRSSIRFQVRFGTDAGERRAYFTEAGPGTICDLEDRRDGPLVHQSHEPVAAQSLTGGTFDPSVDPGWIAAHDEPAGPASNAPRIVVKCPAPRNRPGLFRVIQACWSVCPIFPAQGHRPAPF